MAAIRLLLIVATLIGFFLVGLPLWLVARTRPAMAHRMTLLLCRALLRLAKVEIEVEGTWSPARPMMLVANHVSWIDILALAALAPFCFLAKREVSRWPLISGFAAMQGTVFVDRLRRRSIPGANRDMAARMLEGRMVLLFPEGTTLAGPCPGPFRSSHFAAARDLLESRSVEERGGGAARRARVFAGRRGMGRRRGARAARLARFAAAAADLQPPFRRADCLRRRQRPQGRRPPGP